jgi:hypothetical protein
MPSAETDGVASGAALGGAILSVVFWLLSAIWGIEVPQDIAPSISAIVVAACAWIGKKWKRRRN